MNILGLGIGEKDANNAAVDGSRTAPEDGQSNGQRKVEGCGSQEAEANERVENCCCRTTGKEQVGPCRTETSTEAVGAIVPQNIIDGINTAIQLIQLNRSIATSQLMTQVEKLIATIKGDHPRFCEGLAKLLGVELSVMCNVIDGVDQFVTFEKTVLDNGYDTKVISILEKLKSRPFILRLLAAII